LAIATPLATAAASKLGIKAEAVPDRTNPNWDLIGEETIERGKPWRA
jgi:hypothetical protein